MPAAGIDFGQAEDTIEKQVAQAHDEQVKIYSADYYEWSLDSYDGLSCLEYSIFRR